MESIIITTQRLIKEMLEFIDDSPWKSQYSARLHRLILRTEQPCELAIAGRVKAGKSSFLNALLGEDLAMVGTTETTATINFFRYGIPPDPERPVRVVWDNGLEEYHPRSFLDSLQGNNEEALLKAKGIDRLEYLLQNEMLKEVTLVDTPGTDAIVDEHEQRTDDYFNPAKVALCKKHSDQSKELTERADAVVYITERVATNANKSFLTKYLGTDTNGASALNAIGVMTKVDISDEVMNDRIQLSSSIAEKLHEELNTVVPVSAGIYRAVKKLQHEGRLMEMQQKLKTIPQRAFDFLLDRDVRYKTDEKIYPKICNESGAIALTPQEREELLGTLDWRVFVVIARQLYEFPLDEAIGNLIELSGMEQVKEVLENHFFKRSRMIRCCKVTQELRDIFYDLEQNGIHNLRNEMRDYDHFKKFISSQSVTSPDNLQIADKLRQFIARHTITPEKLESLQMGIKELKVKVEILQADLFHIDEGTQALLLLDKSQTLFSREELEELKVLFGLYGMEMQPNDEAYIAKRYAYWWGQYNRSLHSERKRLAQQAAGFYGTIK